MSSRRRHLPTVLCWLLLAALAPAARAAAASAPAAVTGAAVAYQLPTDGPLPRTWLVTLAIVDAEDPDWIVSQFASGVVRTVTAENRGRFTETWDGLDDNYMPVPPGTYALKGICMPAAKWAIDGEYHGVVPRYVTSASSWQSAGTGIPREPFGGDPVGAPLEDVAVGPNGVAVFYYQYLENGTNNPMFDLKKPVGPDQFLRAFPSGGAGGGSSTTTDGESVWSFSIDGGKRFVYRADQKPFGTGAGAHRNHVYLPDGWVTAMASSPGAGGATVVYVAQRGRMVDTRHGQTESASDFVDAVTVHAGADGAVLASAPLHRPRGLSAKGGVLHALHARPEGGFAVSSARLVDGLPQAWTQTFVVPAGIEPFGFAVDAKGRHYLSDPPRNRVLQLDAAGKVLRTYGRLPAQKPGAYDRETFIDPGRLATWTAPDGGERLLVVERSGPNRVSEWSADGALIREFLNLQTKANDGWTVDPANARHVYVPGQRGWLTRFDVDQAKRTWTVDAVWPLTGIADMGWVQTNDNGDTGGAVVDHPRFVRAAGREYLVAARNYVVYRRDGADWVLSAALMRKRADGKSMVTAWHDADGDQQVDAEECAPLASPPGVFRYHGEQWLEDLSLVAIGQGTRDVWRLAPASFDQRGNPVFASWAKLLTDTVLEARATGKGDALRGGNELTDSFNSDWAMCDGTVEQGFYVNARGGKARGANFGAQHKISRYVPDGRGGYRMKWRTGRAALGAIARPGEIVGAMHMNRPINGLLAVIDQTRAGVLLYTEEGLYVDSLFPDERKLGKDKVGVYALPGEFFAGALNVDPASGAIGILMGKYTPQLFTIDGWSLRENPVRALAQLQPTVTISAAQIASPSELALALRGGAGAARLASVAPAIGGAVLDGSLTGWESCEPVRFAADAERTVEVRLLYDPDHLYLRWHARLGSAFAARPLAPIERIFTHDRLADTLNLYIQGDPAAAPATSADGRPGDARVVFGLFDQEGTLTPAALGMHPTWNGAGQPQKYSTKAGGTASFAHVGPVAGARLAHRLDEDGKGFVLVAAIPRAAIPALPPLAGGLRTQVNFAATFAGHTRFWWADRDGKASRETYDEPNEARFYPGSWAPLALQGLEGGVALRHWQVCGPFGGPGAEAFRADPSGDEKGRARKLLDAAGYPPDQGGVDLAAVFGGEAVRGWWPDPKQVRWKPASLAALDTRVVLGEGAQVWYGATWISAPEEMTLDCAFQGHQQTFLRFTLNGEQVRSGEIRADGQGTPVATRPITLRRGWNELRFRGYCVGYPPFRAGAVLHGPAGKLWKLRLSGQPP